MEIKPCPHGGKVSWKCWSPFPGFDFLYLECTRQRCDYGDYDCTSDYFQEEEAVIIDWNRRMAKKIKKQED